MSKVEWKFNVNDNICFTKYPDDALFLVLDRFVGKHGKCYYYIYEWSNGNKIVVSIEDIETFYSGTDRLPL